MICPNCKANVSDAVAFCENCGTRLRDDQQASGAFEQTQRMPDQAIPQQPYAQPSPYDQTGQQAYGQQTQQQDSYTQAPYATQQMPYGQASQQPYGQPGQQPYGMPGTGSGPAKQGSNAPFVLAIIALVTAILGLFPISIILAIIALVMNSGQKKRGESSTKQTPTFVMSLISIIVSALMAILTAIIGGAVWVALVNGDIDYEGGPRITSVSVTTDDADPVGTWSIQEITIEGEDYGSEYLDTLRALGGDFGLVLTKDGSATLTIPDEEMSGTWTDKGSGEIQIEFDGEALDGTIDGDTLTVAEDDNKMVFKKESSDTKALSSSSSTSSSSASSSSTKSSSSSSASSSTKKKSSSSSSKKDADSYSTSERPSLADFGWITGEAAKGNVPSGAKQITDFGNLKGGWKAYQYGEIERFFNVTIGGKKDSAKATFDWWMVSGKDDDTPDSKFTGTFDGGTLDATGSGRVTIAAFWQKDGKQYGVGSFMWPSGEVDTIALVRP